MITEQELHKLDQLLLNIIGRLDEASQGDDRLQKALNLPEHSSVFEKAWTIYRYAFFASKRNRH